MVIRIRVSESGYIQYIDPESVLTLARENDLVIRLLCKPGHFVWQETIVALVWPARSMNEELERELQNAFRVGTVRTPTQDLVYAVNQLTEMAVRAMSPAINDPFTAMTCLDHLSEGLGLFIQQGRKESSATTIRITACAWSWSRSPWTSCSAPPSICSAVPAATMSTFCCIC